MAILIDGYNLLHVTGVFSPAVGPGAVEKLHQALIDDLLALLDPAEVRQLTIVFDAKGRRASSRRMVIYREVTLHYSSRNEDADTLLQELIDQHAAPRQLVVVSSDHQVQRAARRRRAKPVDSEVWYAACRLRRRTPQPDADSRPTMSIDPVDFPMDLEPAAEHETDPSRTHPFSPSYLAEIQRELLADPPVSGDRPKGHRKRNRKSVQRPIDDGKGC